MYINNIEILCQGIENEKIASIRKMLERFGKIKSIFNSVYIDAR